MQGATIIEGVAGHRRAHASAARSPACAPPHGDIEAEYVVNCAGMWARQLGAQAGVNIPLQAAEHYYLITEPIDGRRRRTGRCSRTRPSYGYFREEVGGLMVGLFEPVLRAVERRRHPGRLLVRRDPARLGPHGRRTSRRRWRACRSRWRPASGSSSAARRASRPTCSRSSARRPSCKNYFVAAGLNSIGILTGGGLGRVLAHWIVDGRPDVDVTGMNIDRLHPYQANPEYRAHAHRRVARHGLPVPLPDAVDADRARREAVADPRPAGRAAAPTSATSAAGRAPTGTRPPGVEPDAGALSWGRPDWFGYWAAEHHAAREGVILMDMSFMAKFLVQGRDAGRVLEPDLGEPRRRRRRA